MQGSPNALFNLMAPQIVEINYDLPNLQDKWRNLLKASCAEEQSKKEVGFSCFSHFSFLFYRQCALITAMINDTFCRPDFIVRLV